MASFLVSCVDGWGVDLRLPTVSWSYNDTNPLAATQAGIFYFRLRYFVIKTRRKYPEWLVLSFVEGSRRVTLNVFCPRLKPRSRPRADFNLG